MSQNFLHTQHGTKLFVFLGLLAWFAVSVTLRCFFCNLLGTMVFLFHADNNVSEIFRHTTQNGSKGAFSVLLRKVWLTGFRTVHNMVGSGGPKCPCGRWLSSLRRQDLARQWQAWPDGPDRESLSMPVLLVCVGIVFSCFLDLHYLVLLCRNGSTSNGGSTEGCGTGISASNATVTCGAPTAGLQTGTAGPAACRAPGYRPENSLSGNPLLSWRPARISVFRVPPWGRQLETFFRVCTNEIQLSLERSPHQNLTPIDVERETL